MSESEVLEKNEFQVSQNMIFHVIKHQAGSIEKAILETLMNAVDAKATEVRVDLSYDGKKYTIKDNGKGFATEKEIKDCFGVFGFDHGNEEENYRDYGTFGIGRAQLWAFSKNIWYTNNYRLDVDIKNNGLNYDLRSLSEKVNGCTIEGEFYERQTAQDIQNVIKELKKLALYLPINLFINDKKVNKEISKESWDKVTNEAYIKFNQNNEMQIYNKGVFVRSYPSYSFGSGGVVVTKDNLKLNTARNDIILSECQNWKKIKKTILDNSNFKNLNKKSLNDSERQNLISQFIAGELKFRDIHNKKIIKDVCGRHSTIMSFYSRCKKITVSDTNKSQIGENIHNNKIAFVLSPNTLFWFGVDTVHEFIELLSNCCKRDGFVPSDIKNLNILDFNELKNNNSVSYQILGKKDLTAKQKAIYNIMGSMNNYAYKFISLSLNEHLSNDNKFNYRSTVFGNGDAVAWTDSETYIAFNAKEIQNLVESYGVDGLIKVFYIFIHEYLHNDNSNKDHVHSFEFYESFHNILMDSKYSFNIFEFSIDMMAKIIKSYEKEKIMIPKVILRQQKKLLSFMS